MSVMFRSIIPHGLLIQSRGGVNLFDNEISENNVDIP